MSKQMDKLDKILKERLKHLEATPSPMVWEGVMQQYAASRASTRRAWMNGLAVLILTGLSFVLLSDIDTLVVEGPDDIPMAPGIVMKQDQPQEVTSQDNSQKFSAFTQPVVAKESTRIADELQLVGKPNHSLSQVVALIPYAETPEPDNFISGQAQDPVIPEVDAGSKIEMTGGLVEVQPMQAGALNHDTVIETGRAEFPREASSEDMPEMLPRPAENPIISSFFRPVWRIGLFYIPELYHSANTRAERTLLGFETLMRVSRHQYSLETGLGISRVSNDNLYQIDYNGYLGSYKGLDSISFSLDPVSQTIVPTYFFNEVSVHDTAIRTQYTRMKNQYTYLQIPVLIGYQSVSYSRISYRVHGGPMLALLIGSREPDAYFDARLDKIVRINDKTPGRVRASWQFLLGTGLNYQMTERLGLVLEPGVRIHLNPIYQQDGFKPWSVNLRMGAVYELRKP